MVINSLFNFDINMIKSLYNFSMNFELDPDLFDLFCYEEMEAPSVEEIRSWVNDLWQFDLPVTVYDKRQDRWIEFRRWCKNLKPGDDFISFVLPISMVISKLGYEDKQENTTTCFNCVEFKFPAESEEFMTPLRTIEIEGKAVLEFLCADSNYCQKCKRPCFKIENETYIEYN